MSLRYILGPASAGKTKCALSEITSSLKSGKNLIYIVPEQFTLQSESDIIKISGEMAILQIQVLSFNRLSYHVFSEVGFNREKTIDNIGKNMLIRKLAMDIEDELIYYDRSIDKHGFIEEISQLITEFYQYGVTAELLRSVASKPQTNKNLSDKLTDIAKIYEGYNDYIRNGCISADDSLDFLALVIDNSEYLQNACIWIDGFYGFNPQELKIITHLMKMADKLTVALTTDENKTSFDKLSEFDVFHETKQTINTLTRLAHELNVTIDKPVFLLPVSSGQLTHLRNSFYSDGDFKCKSQSNQIYISAHSNFYEEVENSASYILHLVRDKNYRFHDIAISITDLNVYKKIIKGIYAQYDIPVFIDDKEDVLSHPLTELIRSIVGIVCKRWSYESVFRLLKTNMLPIDRDDLFDFENYCLEFGIGEIKWRYDAWTSGFYSNRYDKEKINAIKDLIKAALKPFTHDLKLRTKLSVTEFSTRIFGVLTELKATETLSKWIEDATIACDNLQVRKHRQIWGLICHVFDEMTEILGNEKMTVKEFAKVLDSGLASVDMGIIPPSKDQVLIGDISRSRLPDIKALLVLGMNEGLLVPPDSGAFIESERNAMRENGVNLSASFHQKILRQELYVYSLFSKPSDFLLISCSSGSLDGKTFYPSTIINRLKEIYPNSTGSFLPENFIKTKKSMLKDVGTLLNNFRHNIGLSGTETAILEFYERDAVYSQVIRKMNGIVHGENIRENLTADTVDKLYGNEIISDVSRLESYIQCPFSYFIKYNLKASERKVYKVDYVDLGILFHAVLEEFSKLLDLYSTAWSDLDEKTIKRFVMESLEVIKKNDSMEIFGASGANAYLLERVTRIAEKSIWALSEHMKMGDFIPWKMEYSFKSEAITGITLDIGNEKKFILTGRIDRIDVMDLEGKLYVKIIDYKSGAKKFSCDDIYYGMQLQLMLYLDFFMKTTKIVPEKQPGGIFYFNINDPILSSDELNFKTNVFNEQMVKELNEKILSKFKMSGLMLADINIAKGLDKTIESNTNRWSRVVSRVQLSKQSESGFSESSTVAALDEFSLLQEYANFKLFETGSDILQGKINKHPFKNSKGTGCDYCKFSAICKFDLVYETNKYRNFKNFGSVGGVIDEIKNTQANKSQKDDFANAPNTN